MYSKHVKIPVDLAIEMVGRWNETYEWIPISGAFAAIAVAFSTGANSLTAPFSTAVGAGALTLFKASIIAYLIYVPGASFASKSTVNSLFSHFVQENQPDAGFLMWGIVVALITAAIWLAVATYWELPVSSQQSIQSGLLGTTLVTEGFGCIPMWNKNENHNFKGGGILWIFLEWTVAPLVACLFAYIFFTLLKVFLLRSDNVEKRILIFLPIDYGISAGLLCLFVMFQIVGNIISVSTWLAIVSVAVATFIGTLLSLALIVPLSIKNNAIPNYKSNKQNGSIDHKSIEIQDKKSFTKEEIDKTDEDVEEMLRDFMQTRALETVYEDEERSCASTVSDKIQDSQQRSKNRSTQFKQLLESTPNPLVQARSFQKLEPTSPMSNASRYIKKHAKSILFPVTEYDKRTLIRHALAEKYDEVEEFFSFPHLLASCIFALIQSAAEVAAIAIPYRAILDVFEHRTKYSGNGEQVESIHVTWWFRGIGGLVAALGFFCCGWRLTQCLGGKLIYMSNTRGLASQISSVSAVIMVTRMNLPVSSVHVSVGSLLGVGMADQLRNVNWKLLLKFLGGWILTIIFCCGIAYVIFSASVHSPAYVVP